MFVIEPQTSPVTMTLTVTDADAPGPRLIRTALDRRVGDPARRDGARDDAELTAERGERWDGDVHRCGRQHVHQLHIRGFLVADVGHRNRVPEVVAVVEDRVGVGALRHLKESAGVGSETLDGVADVVRVVVPDIAPPVSFDAETCAALTIWTAEGLVDRDGDVDAEGRSGADVAQRARDETRSLVVLPRWRRRT